MFKIVYSRCDNNFITILGRNMKLKLTKDNADVYHVKSVIICEYNLRISGVLYENSAHYLIFLIKCNDELHANDVVAWATLVQERFNKDDKTPLRAFEPDSYDPDDELNPYVKWVVAMEFRYK